MLDLIAANPDLTAALVFSGAVLGLLLARLLLPGPKRVRQLEDQLEQAHKEHQAYRSNVTTHFQKTAELVGKMTESYKSVYDHLAYGSQTLCGEYDALTSSVFGPPRIIHDPTVAVGETTVAGAAASAASTGASASTSDAAREEVGAPQAQARESFRFGAGPHDAGASGKPGEATHEADAADGKASESAASAADSAGEANTGTAVGEHERRDPAAPTH